MVVMKFGGTSVKDPEAIRRLARIVAREQGISGVPVVVVSAMSGITDQLLDAVLVVDQTRHRGHCLHRRSVGRTARDVGVLAPPALRAFHHRTDDRRHRARPLGVVGLRAAAAAQLRHVETERHLGGDAGQQLAVHGGIRFLGPTLGERIVVAWDGGREAARAVNDALPFLTRAKSVSVVVFNASSRADRHGSVAGADIALHLARHGVKVAADRFDSRMQTLPREDFPTLPEVTGGSKATLPSAAVKEMVAKTQFAITGEDTRYFLNGAKFVLNQFKKSQHAAVSDLIDRGADAVEAILKDGLAAAMNRFNQRPK